jgi:hypothetical protein
MPTQAIIGYGSKLKVDTSGGSTYATEVGQVEEANLPDIAQTDVKMSHLQSPNRYHEYRPGMVEPGEFKFKILFEKNQYSALLGYLNTGLPAANTPYAWKWIFSDGASEAGCSYMTFTGHVKSMGAAIPMDDKVSCDVTIKVTGKPVFNIGSGS